ncbi:MAG: hypothetical protein KGY76_06220 [Candidatus Thermoplasmatota archaeon]|nr:hypothetical protein [Candidatus Thermoplasmatota archaeon]
MAEAVKKSVADTLFLDDTDDFIQSDIDSHLPPSEEVIEEDLDDDEFEEQFNPRTKEVIVPEAEEISVDTEVDKGWFDTDAWSDITVKLRDPGGFYKLELEVTDRDNSATLYRSDAEYIGDGILKFETTIDIDYAKDYLDDYTLKIEAEDDSGNSFKKKKDIDGVFGGIVDGLVDLVKGIVDAAMEAAGALASGLINKIVKR